jgi:Phage protein Gp19/Gp15/Gp42
MGSPPCRPFATSAELSARWRPLTQLETQTADVLLDDASQMIRERFPDVDIRIEAETLSRKTVSRIVCAMVKRAMIGGGGESVSSQGQTAGPFGITQSFANPMGNLYLGKDDLIALGVTRGGKAFSVVPS